MAPGRSRLLLLAVVLLLFGALANFSSYHSSIADRSSLGEVVVLEQKFTAGDRGPVVAQIAEETSPISAATHYALKPLSTEHLLADTTTCISTNVVLDTRIGGPSGGGELLAQDPEACACARPVAHDVDHGRTLFHVMKRHFCQNSAAHGAAPDAQPRRRPLPMRIVQVGANTGDNANDHLVAFLKSSVAQGVLFEPVPWIFRRLSATYAAHTDRTVRLVNAAMSEQDGNVSFVAPNEKSSGWLPQMGGLNLPPKTLKTLKKQGGLRMFDRITVQSLRFSTLLQKMGWTEAPPDVFVVDAEGYDHVIMKMVLDSVQAMFGEAARIPILQFEWKHIGAEARTALWNRLIGLGYCVMQVHYDDVALYHPLLRSEVGTSSCSASFDLHRINS